MCGLLQGSSRKDRWARGSVSFVSLNSPDKNLQAKVQLDKLPSPLTTDIVNPKSFLRWETQRGCPYHCSFCQHRDATASGVAKIYQHRIQEELDWLKEKNIDDIAILDPTFNTDTLHATWVLSKLPKSKVSLQIRPETGRGREAPVCSLSLFRL